MLACICVGSLGTQIIWDLSWNHVMIFGIEIPDFSN